LALHERKPEKLHEIARLIPMKHMIWGILLVGLGAYGLHAWWPSFGQMMRGFLPFALLALGLVAFLSGYNRLATDDEEEEEGI
jgi:hypothetical protein